MRVDVMTIPANVVDGVELRPAVSGPVFTAGPHGRLAMRYTDRRRNIGWRSDPETSAAVAALREILEAPDTPRFRVRLEPGWGLICNNVLHNRDRFGDTAGSADREGRLLYRARYHDRVEGS